VGRILNLLCFIWRFPDWVMNGLVEVQARMRKASERGCN
jgi:hypothetical protein